MLQKAVKPNSAHEGQKPLVAASGGRASGPATAALWTRALPPLPLQAKLTVNQPGDIYEQEADRVAAQVMRMPDPAAGGARRCACGGMADETGECPACRAKRLALQRKSDAAGGVAAPPSVHETLRAPGRPLDGGARAFMESRFGHDFGGVRVYTDSGAAASARAVGAQAYTVGQNVVFGEGRYAPGTDDGKRLLAHELAHVVQQDSGHASWTVQRQLYPPMPIIVNPPRIPAATTVEINAVDARQEPSTEWYKPWRYAGPLANFFRGDVTMTDINSMVTNVIAHLNGRSISRLNVMDHGNEQGAQIGDDWLTSAADVNRFAGTLGRLRSHFASGAFVHMQNCNSGQNRELICALAAAFGVTVYAGTGMHHALLNFNFGSYVSCSPDGTFNPNAARPSTSTRPSTLMPEPGGPIA